jgi:hypothetical protein
MVKDTIKSLIITKQKEIPFPMMERDDELPLNSQSIVTVVGVRRCGKSSKMQLTINALVEKGLSPEAVLWVGFDDERLAGMKVSELDEVLEAYRELYPTQDLKDVYMFFDEIQLIANWELFVMRVFKSYCKNIFVSGSNAKMLSQEIATTLRGWSIEEKTYPLSFKEYCQFTGIKTHHLTEQETTILRLKWNEYCMESAFPEIVLTELKSLRDKKLQSYFDAMLFRDLVERHNISNTGVLRYFIKRLMNNLTKPTSINAIYNDIKSQGFKISKDDLYLWADYVCECFMFLRISKYTPSLIEEQQSLRKYYFIDNGLRQAVLLPQSDDNGKLLENAVLLHLNRRLQPFDKITYYSGTKECDFVIQHEQQVKALYQVCWDIQDTITRQREIDGIIEASKMTKCDNLFIITHDNEDIIIQDGKTINIIPAWKWMLNN